MALPPKETLDWWRPKLRSLDPRREVGADEIDKLYAERRRAPYQALATDLATAPPTERLKTVLCGARGSGKSTELIVDYVQTHSDER